MRNVYIEPSYEAVVSLIKRKLNGPIIMLNLLRFREIADYTANPELAANFSISGREAFQRYIEHTHPFLESSGGSIRLIGECEDFLIGPSDEHWHMVMLIQQHSLESFLAFASNRAYLSGIGHRTAALLDSRLLPVIANSELNLSD